MKDTRLRLLKEREVSLVLDVGANAGQYATRLRADGYRGRIISFEPLGAPYARLEAFAADDPNWETRRIALGAAAARKTINVSENSYSSSLLPICDVTVTAAPDARYVEEEEVEVVTLDSLDIPARRNFLKIDVQGYELQVLRGANESLQRVLAVELELSLVPLYAGQALAPEICAFLREHGFVPLALEPEFSDPTTGELLQVNGLFVRPSV
jgi:FkbM family methyltransferase